MSPITVVLLLVCVARPLVAGFGYDEDYLVPPSCKPCDATSCPELKYCAGKVLKDNCGCCPRCSSKLFQPHPMEEPESGEVTTATPEVDPCEARQCPKFKVCMVNQQGLPICRCPSLYVCKTKGRSRNSGVDDLRICGTDGLTYESRCHLRIASCQNTKRIKRKHKGPCLESGDAATDDNQLLPAKDNVKNVDVFGSTADESELLQRVQHARRKKPNKRRKKKNRKMSRSERKAFKERKRLERKNRLRQKRRRRMKRRNRNQSYSVYSDQYGYLLGRHTNWSKSQVRKSRI